ncbi:MAG: rod shape-determining protein MreC [Lachnospiraceae bacterium]|nr:rod shape-determining protein MreC [Lachnospiraceae bacterium]
MRFKKKHEIPPKYILLVLTILCLIFLLISLLFENVLYPLKSVTATIIIPMQEAVNSIGIYVENKTEMLEELTRLQEENAEIKEQLETYKAETKEYQQDLYELDRLRILYKLDETYPSYEKVAARVISRDTGNWFHTFIINKGTGDGIDVDCNVLSGNGLVGIVTEVGKNWAKVRAIIDDTSNVSAMFINNSELCTVRGNLTEIDNGYIDVEFIGKDADVNVGDEIVTSYISDKYLSGITIGYVSEITMDANNLTKSAKLIPVVDFSNIQEVLVIKDKKQNDFIEQK